MKFVFIFIVLIHGFIHLMGFAKAFELAQIKELSRLIPKWQGVIWLITTVLFLTAAATFFLRLPHWWMYSAPAILISQVLIFTTWSDAKFGTIANILILIVTVVGYGHWRMLTGTETVIHDLLPDSIQTKTVSEQDIQTVPPIVQTWLRQSGVIGSETVQTVFLKQRGSMRTKPGGTWMPFTAQQWFNVPNPGFVWITTVDAGPGFFFSGRDVFLDGRGRMLIKVLSLFPVVDETGERLDQATMLRYLAETVWFPSAALQDYIHWDSVDSTTVRATMRHKGIEASGVYQFTPDGKVKSFEAQRYYSGETEASLETWHIGIDTTAFMRVDGIRIPTKSIVTWKLEDGDYAWLRLEVTDMVYNRSIAPVTINLQ